MYSEQEAKASYFPRPPNVRKARKIIAAKVSIKVIIISLFLFIVESL